MIIYNLKNEVPNIKEIELIVEGGIQDIVPFKNNKLFVFGRFGKIYLIKFNGEELEIEWESNLERRV